MILLRARILLLLLLLLHEKLLLLAPPGRAQFLEAGLHLLQDLRGVADDQLDTVLGCLQELHGFFMVFTLDTLQEQDKSSSESSSK